MMGYTYILLCNDSTFYVGSTRDLARRIAQHKSGDGSAYTRKRRPVRLVYIEEYETVTEAYGRERQIHGWTHGRKRQLVRDGPGISVNPDTESQLLT